VEATPAADPAAVQEAPATPQPEPETLLLPDIPPGAPAPAQIKRLAASGIACLTFDDGYSKASIQKILSCLRSSDVQCTFFVIGACLKKYPDLWRQAVEDGNEIAYHTMKHGSLNRCSNEKIVRDINQWNDAARSVLGVGYRIPKFGRAPGGSANARVRRLFNCIGYRLIYWSSDTYTGVYRGSKRNAAARIARYIVKRTTAGSISLQHFNKYDASSVSRYIAALKEKYTLGTISEALAASGSG
jgi:peptidoglycan/xylan/chitin deacetylase (PgdA/CDA1 family)